ncbi:MAG: PAN domain-containing protein [Brevundimonas sp.]|uniref:PAN domain-containing protein n=1 Tax=Brevundimonas sp. TaxID=1871086 RepID=UPI0025BE2B6E|nr:PAN domain-containing protein [Brevundimonas sp.]MBX3478389.1 PAN domain-containing protein [Brevundimonas sp.]
MRLAILAVLALTAALGWGAASSARQTGVAPVGSPARCLAVASVMVEAESESVRAGRMILALGETNGASQADMARTRQSVEEAERAVASSRAIAARFPPDTRVDATTKRHLMDAVSIGALRTELADCAASPAAAPAPSRVVNGFVREDGQDRPGNDLGMVEVRTDDFEACRALCAANDRCRAFTLYTPPPREKSFCWLKHAAGPARADPHSVGGVRR